MALEMLATRKTFTTLFDLANVRPSILATYPQSGGARGRRAIAAIQGGGGGDPPPSTLLGEIGDGLRRWRTSGTL